MKGEEIVRIAELDNGLIKLGHRLQHTLDTFVKRKFKIKILQPEFNFSGILMVE